MGALASLTSLRLYGCAGLSALPASLWRVPLRELWHYPEYSSLSDEASRNALLVPGLPASAPCCASMRSLCLEGHGMLEFPACVLGMKRLTHLELRDNCFEQLPEGVSALTALEALYPISGCLASGAPWTRAPWGAWAASRTCTACALKIAACCSARASGPPPRTPACRSWCWPPRTLPVARHAGHFWVLSSPCCSRGAGACCACEQALFRARGRRTARTLGAHCRPWALRCMMTTVFGLSPKMCT